MIKSYLHHLSPSVPYMGKLHGASIDNEVKSSFQYFNSDTNNFSY